MLQSVDVGERSLEAMRGIVSDALIDEVRQAAADLAGARVLHVNATPYGGGVSELLRSIVPLLNDLGLVAEWQVIGGEEDFFDTTKTIHNGLQGMAVDLPQAARDKYRSTNAANATALGDQSYDFVFIHDAQPAALLDLHGKDESRWIWRCHIDTYDPNPDTWQFVRGFLTDYDAAIFTMAEFLPPDLPIEHVELIPPAIDPLSPKNLDLGTALAQRVLDWLGIDLERPMITQISRFDPWKDPLGVIDAYRIAREEIADLQLVLAGSMALDDPEGWDVYRQIQAASEQDPRIRVFTNLTGVGNIEVNALQREAAVVVQKSIREGFGLVVSEALWKQTAVVAGRSGGIPLQMADGSGGVLVDSAQECASAIVDLLNDVDRRRQLAASGRERVREHFLLPRLLLNELSLMLDLVRAGEPLTRAAPETCVQRDPVCGMAIEVDAAHLTETYDGRCYSFCSQACRTKFLDHPDRYVAAERPLAT